MAKFYVYVHIEPETGEIVYVGKGTRERVIYSYHRSEEHAAFMVECGDKFGPKGNWWACDHWGLSAKEAFKIEAELIKRYNPKFNKAGK